MIARALPLAFLLLSACGSSDTHGGKSAPTAAKTVQTVSAKLTPAYLQGPWCYTHHIAGGERSEERINYIFSADGSLLYQVNPTTSVDKPGSYTINNGHLKILPTLRFFDFTVETLEPDVMVLKMGFGQAYWQRGSCGE